MAAVWGYAEPLRVLCARELQVSIKESFHAELKAAIQSEPWLINHYDIGVDYLRGRNGTEFLFRGLRHNSSGIKSLAKIDLTIVEEAEDVPEGSWLDLEATVFRQPKSELWSIWNPKRQGSPVDDRFRKNPPPNSLIAEINWRDNPFFPEGLEKLRTRQQEMLDPNTYAWIWEGAYLTNSIAQVLSGKVEIREFTAEPAKWDGPYYGLDFGFSQDPTAAIRCWVWGDCLWIDYEAGARALEIDQTAGYLINRIPDITKNTIRADNARPESISYLARNGLPRVVAVKKGAGSVEDGVAHLRSYKKIIVHPRCTETERETRLWSYKVDRLTGDVLPILLDQDNHYMDALRYALEPLIKNASFIFDC
jgi:phage terminase large subunit